MIDPEHLTLAQSYANMAATPAFKDLLSFLRLECEKAELQAAAAPPNDPQSRFLFVAWQQRRMFLNSVIREVESSAETLKVMQEEMENERSIERERASRTSW